MNSVMLGQNAKPVNASSPASPALQTAVAAPATENENLSDKTDENDSRAWLPPGEDPENRLTTPFLKHLGQRPESFLDRTARSAQRSTGNGWRPSPDSPAP